MTKPTPGPAAGSPAFEENSIGRCNEGHGRRAQAASKVGVADAEEKREEKAKLSGELASNVVKFSEFLDPHLGDAAKADRAAAPQRWSYRRAAIFIIAASLVLWGGIIAAFHYVYRFLFIEGRP